MHNHWFSTKYLTKYEIIIKSWITIIQIRNKTRRCQPIQHIISWFPQCLREEIMFMSKNNSLSWLILILSIEQIYWKEMPHPSKTQIFFLFWKLANWNSKGMQERCYKRNHFSNQKMEWHIWCWQWIFGGQLTEQIDYKLLSICLEDLFQMYKSKSIYSIHYFLNKFVVLVFVLSEYPRYLLLFCWFLN